MLPALNCYSTAFKKQKKKTPSTTNTTRRGQFTTIDNLHTQTIIKKTCFAISPLSLSCTWEIESIQCFTSSKEIETIFSFTIVNYIFLSQMKSNKKNQKQTDNFKWKALLLLKICFIVGAAVGDVSQHEMVALLNHRRLLLLYSSGSSYHHHRSTWTMMAVPCQLQTRTIGDWGDAMNAPGRSALPADPLHLDLLFPSGDHQFHLQLKCHSEQWVVGIQQQDAGPTSNSMPPPVSSSFLLKWCREDNTRAKQFHVLLE